jgi:hypothetical protein
MGAAARVSLVLSFALLSSVAVSAPFDCASLLPGNQVTWGKTKGTDSFACVALNGDKAEVFRVIIDRYPDRSVLRSPGREPANIGGIRLKWAVDESQYMSRHAMITLPGPSDHPINLVLAIPRCTPERVERAKQLIALLRIPQDSEFR